MRGLELAHTSPAILDALSAGPSGPERSSSIVAMCSSPSREAICIAVSPADERASERAPASSSSCATSPCFLAHARWSTPSPEMFRASTASPRLCGLRSLAARTI